MSLAAGGLPRFRFTDRWVRSAGPGEYWDSLVPGLGLRVYDTGRKSWVILYRRNRRKIGSYPATELADARTRAREMLGAAEDGRDPFAPGVRDIEEVSVLYLDQHASTLSEDWQKDIRRTLKRDIIPWIGHRSLDDVRRSEIVLYLDRVRPRGPHAVRHVRSVLSGIYRWALDRELCETNPTSRLKIGRPASRDYVLSDGEIRAAWGALIGSGTPAARAALFSLLTARRLRECRTLRWEWREGPWWTIPKSLTKSRRFSIRFYAPPLAWSLLREPGDIGYVFHTDGEPPSKELLSHTVARLRRGAEWRAQDFRRTAATLMAQNGISRFIVKQVLGHVDSSVTAVYDRYRYDPEKREAIVVLAWELRRIIRSSPTSTRRAHAPTSPRRRLPRR